MIATDVLFNPFPGLRSFEEEEDHLFFGRETQIDELLRKLRTEHFLAVVGSSGSGKSSLVKSGLLPSLHSGYMASVGSFWNVEVFRPGRDPIGNMSAALARMAIMGEKGHSSDEANSESNDEAIIEATLRRSRRGLVEMRQQSNLEPQENLLLVVDQFEELFRFHEHDQGNSHSQRDDILFINLLLFACQQQEARIFIVLTMRSDFLGECTEFRGLPEAINQSQYLIPRMTREQRKAAITGPVAVGGASITPRLVTRLLNDVGDNPDQLPILQHALMRTWDHWEKSAHAEGALDIPHYEAIGTMKEALSLHAEEAFAEIKDNRLKGITAGIFRALTDRGEMGQGIRRPIKLKEICELTAVSKEVAVGIIDLFRTHGRSFLMPPAGVTIDHETVIDISHESLMRIWARLIQWVKEENQSSEIYLRLAAAAARYQEGQAGLWQGPELELALRWQAEAKPTLLWAQRYDPSYERAMSFLMHSRKQRDLEIAKRERRQQLRLRRARIVSVVIGAAAIFSLILSFIAYDQKLQADEQRKIAEKQTEIAKKNEIEANNQRKIAEANEEKARKNHEEAVHQQQMALSNEKEAKRQEQKAIRNAAEARREREVAVALRVQAEAAREEAEDRRKQAQAASKRAEEERQKALRLKNVAEARNESLAAIRLLNERDQTAGIQKAIEAYQLNSANDGPQQNKENYLALLAAYKSGDSYAQLEKEHKAGVRTIAINPVSGVVASGDDFGKICISSLQAPKKKPSMTLKADGPVRSLSYSPDGVYLAAGLLNGQVLIWKEGSPEPIGNSVIGHSVPFLGFVRIGDEWQLFFQAGNQLYRHEPEASEDQKPQLIGHCTLAALSREGTHLLMARDTLVTLYHVQDSDEDLLKPVHRFILPTQEKVAALAISDDLQCLAVGTVGGRLYMNRRAEQVPVSLPGHGATISALAFHRFGETLQLVSVGYDQYANLIDVGDWLAEKPREDLVPIPLGQWLYSIAYSQGGDFLIAGGANKGVNVWPARAGKMRDFLDHSQSNNK